jgi:hypothetical protein
MRALRPSSDDGDGGESGSNQAFRRARASSGSQACPLTRAAIVEISSALSAPSLQAT